MCTKGIHSRVLNDTLDQYPQSTLHWPSTSASVDTRSTLDQHLGRESTNFCRHTIQCRSITIPLNRLTLDQLSTDCQWVLIETLIGCWLSLAEMKCSSSVDRDVDWGLIKSTSWHSTVNALVHMIWHSYSILLNTCLSSQYWVNKTLEVQYIEFNSLAK